MSRKVLVVDDEKLIVKGIRFSLEQDGMEVDCAYDGEEAVERSCAVREATMRRKKRQRAFRWAIFVWTVKADVYLLQEKRLI